MQTSYFIQPTWSAPANIHAYTSLRDSGISRPPDNRFDHQHLMNLLNLPNEPIWLKQIHSNTVVEALPKNRNMQADASISHQPNQICVIQTADCLPILLCAKNGTEVAAIHAGWRGLSQHIVTQTIQSFHSPANELVAWIGPGISQTHYEVGDEVRHIFISDDPSTQSAFIPSTNGRWLANLLSIATMQLQKQGIVNIYGGDFCTFSDSKNFFSYRRDGANAGRIISLIWISQHLKK